MHNACIFNQGAQINYTAKYICFLSLYDKFEDKRTLDYI